MRGCGEVSRLSRRLLLPSAAFLPDFWTTSELLFAAAVEKETSMSDEFISI